MSQKATQYSTCLDQDTTVSFSYINVPEGHSVKHMSAQDPTVSFSYFNVLEGHSVKHMSAIRPNSLL